MSCLNPNKASTGTENVSARLDPATNVEDVPDRASTRTVRYIRSKDRHNSLELWRMGG